MSSETTSNNFNKTIVILGPTGSGKTGVSIKIAKEIGGEIISADSRAIYKGMDIGTAKPSLEEQDGVPHFGIDLVEPGERRLLRFRRGGMYRLLLGERGFISTLWCMTISLARRTVRGVP